MTQHTQTPSMPSPLWQYWRGLSGWNFYFLVKFGLLWAGYLNFHPLLNLVFMAFLLMPIPKYRLHRLRHWIAIPVGFALFWHDTWLPGPQSIMSQGTQVAEFSSGYLLDLIARFINWQRSAPSSYCWLPGFFYHSGFGSRCLWSPSWYG